MSSSPPTTENVAAPSGAARRPATAWACLSCGASAHEARGPYRFRSDAFRAVARTRELLRCSACGLVQVDVRGIDPDALRHYYRETYRNTAGIAVQSSPQDVAWFEARGRALAALCRRHVSAAEAVERVLEVGGGYGFNLDALRATFPRARTHIDEPDRAAAGDRHPPGDLQDPAGWDVVLLSHVLEHFTDPVGLLEDVHAALRPGGLCALEVPNEEPEMLERHPYLEPHLTFFRIDTLRTLVERRFAGRFELLEIGTAGPPIRPPSRRRIPQIARALGRRVAARLGLVRNPFRFDFENDAPTPERIFLRAALRKVDSGRGDMPGTTECAAVLVHYRCADDLGRCLASLRAHAPGVHAIVVENGSDDASVAAVRAMAAADPDLELVEATENRGFGAGCNLGIDRALARDPKLSHVLLLNPDTELEPGCVDTLIDTAQRAPGTAIVGGRIEDGDGAVWFENGVVNEWTLSRSHRPAPRDASGDVRREFEAEFVTGALMLVDAGVLRDGLRFDENYFLYAEDLDLCRQARARGHSIRIHLDARIRHHAGGSHRDARPVLDDLRPLQLEQMTRSKVLYARKWLPLHRRLVFYAVSAVAKPLCGLLRARSARFLPSYLRGFFGGLLARSG